MRNTSTLCLICILQFLLLYGRIALAVEVTYEIAGFGSNYTAVTFTGQGGNNLLVTPSSDGRTIKISGVGLEFVALNPEKKSNLINSIKTGTNSGVSELVFYLVLPTEVVTAPSSNKLQLLIKASTIQAIATKSKKDQVKIVVDPHWHGIKIFMPQLSANSDLSRLFVTLGYLSELLRVYGWIGENRGLNSDLKLNKDVADLAEPCNRLN